MLWGVALLSAGCAPPQGCFCGVFVAFTLSITMGTGISMGKGTQFVFLGVVWLCSHSALEWRCMMNRVPLSCMFLYDSNMHAHMHSHIEAHTLQAPVHVGECVCVCECYLNKKERKWIRVVSILIVKQISTKHFEKVNDLRIITIYYSASQGGSWRSPDGYKNGI